MKVLSFILVLLVSSSAFASWAEDFELLKNVPRDYQDAGSICEEIARLDMQEVYKAPQYTVEVGIAYAYDQRTIGELDIIIFDNNTQKVFKVAEVKCWKDVRGGLKKAKEQRSRFQQYVNSGRKLTFKSTTTNKIYDQEQFNYVNEFFSIAQKDTTKQGFDHEMEYSLAEMKEHRKDMIRCQSKKQCATPKGHK